LFSPEVRDRLREKLIADGRADERLTAGALTGSAALGREDRWSDIDLAFSLAPDGRLDEVLATWTDRMYAEHGAVHHIDLTRGETVYRVFLLDTTLQVDIAFAPEAEFGAAGPTFRLLFGKASDLTAKPVDAAFLIGFGWLYALHARSSIARQRRWQAEYMISGLRDQVLAVACLRHGVSVHQARGVDDVPLEATAPLVSALARSLGIDELERAFRAGVQGLLAEAAQVDAGLSERLAAPLAEIAGLPPFAPATAGRPSVAEDEPAPLKRESTW
jgi:hypothetical protein